MWEEMMPKEAKQTNDDDNNNLISARQPGLVIV